MSSPGRKRLFAIAKYVAFAVLLTLLGIALARNFSDVKDNLAEISIISIVGCELAVLGALVCTMLAWRALLSELETTISMTSAARIFFVGQLGKYAPGTVWPMVMQTQMGAAIGLGRPAVATASLLSVAYGLASGVAVTLLAGPALLTTGAWWQWLSVPLGVLVLGLLCLPGPMNRVVALGLKITRRKVALPPFEQRGLVIAVAWSSLSWLLYGLQASWIAYDLGAKGPVTWVSLGAFAGAVSVGLLVIFAPAGAGAREVLLVVLMKPVLGRDAATALALVSRLLQSVGDVIVALSAIITTRGVRMAAQRRIAGTMEEDQDSGGSTTS